MTQQYAKLHPLALAGAFAAAALVAMTLLSLPMQFSMFGMHGSGMMTNGAGYAMGFGSIFFICVWALAVSAIAGAIAATIYNALLASGAASTNLDPASKAH